MDTHEPPTDPSLPPPPKPVDIGEDEIDVDLGDEHQLADDLHHQGGDTIPEGVEYLGTYSTIEAYLRDMVEPEISNAVSRWLLDCIDWREVQARFEQDGSRLFCECGQVFKVSLKANPKPPPGIDPPGPWMPTRGA